MPERLAVAEHRGDRRDRLALHLGGRRPAVERVVVRVQQHRRGVGRPGQRMRRLEHLPDVVRLAVGVGVGEALGERGERRRLRRLSWTDSVASDPSGASTRRAAPGARPALGSAERRAAPSALACRWRIGAHRRHCGRWARRAVVVRRAGRADARVPRCEASARPALRTAAPRSSRAARASRRCRR